MLEIKFELNKTFDDKNKCWKIEKKQSIELFKNIKSEF